MKRAWLGLFCLSLFTAGFTVNSPNLGERHSGSQDNSPKEVVANNPNSEIQLRDRMAQIAPMAQGRVGVTATILETRRSVTFKGSERFPMLSVYKFPVAMAVLAQVDQGKLNLEQKVRIERSDIPLRSVALDQKAQGKEFTIAQLLKYMVSESDNTACDVLLRLIGGPKVVTQYLQALGMKDIVGANTFKELLQNKALQYRNSATPDAIISLLRAFHEGKGLSKSSQELLRRLMTETPTGLKRIKGKLPQGTVVVHKTGTSSTLDTDGVAVATNDVGIVTLPNGHHLAIAVFVSDAKADMATREAAIAQISRTVWDEWSK